MGVCQSVNVKCDNGQHEMQDWGKKTLIKVFKDKGVEFVSKTMKIATKLLSTEDSNVHWWKLLAG